MFIRNIILPLVKIYDIMIVGTAIKYLRKNKSTLNQQEFCKVIGVTQSYLSQVEHNKKTPSLDVLNSVADHFNIPLPVLLWFSIEEGDVAENKTEAYRILKPTIDEMINSVFFTTT